MNVKFISVFFIKHKDNLISIKIYFMSDILQIWGNGIGLGIVGVMIWILAINRIRYHNFSSSCRRSDKPIRGATKEVRSHEIAYHNEAIYRDFEYFFKTTAALLGGAAYLIVQARTKEVAAVLSLLIQLSAILQLLTAFTISAFILAHQKSKIERWSSPFNLFQILFWQETWMILVMWFVAGAYALAVIPLVLQKLI